MFRYAIAGLLVFGTASLALPLNAQAVDTYLDEASFQAAVGSTDLENFETLSPTGLPTTITTISTVLFDVTTEPIGVGNDAWLGIGDPGSFTVDGVNALIAGSDSGASFILTFDLASPASALGFYVTDFRFGGGRTLTLTTSAGDEYSLHELLIPGQAAFFGLVNTDQTFDQFTLMKNSLSDGIGIDRVHLVASETTTDTGPASKLQIAGPLRLDGGTGFERFHDRDGDGSLDEGPFILIKQNFAQHYAFEITVENTDGEGALDDLVLWDEISSIFVLSADLEDYMADGVIDDICIDATCDGYETTAGCDIAFTGPDQDPDLNSTVITIEAVGLAQGATCSARAFVASEALPRKGKGKKPPKFEPQECITVLSPSGRPVEGTITMNTGVQTLDVVAGDALFGPTGPIELIAIGCP